jgi:uncharacterized spore protein YtfJ
MAVDTRYGGYQMTTTGHQESAALRTIRETVDSAAGKVFGEPIQQDGLTVLPVAAVATGGGGGGGSGPGIHGKGESPASDMGGEGGGFGVVAKPAGAFVIKGGEVSWRPAINLNRVIMGGQVVAVVALLVLRGIVRYRSRSRNHRGHHHGHHHHGALRGRMGHMGGHMGRQKH